MRRVVRSRTYARARLVTGTIAAALGIVLIARTAAAVGAAAQAIPAYVLGAALVGLAAVRFREYAQATRAAKEEA
jgi:hypothetical protein